MTFLKGIVFDLDGTLVDSLATTFDAFNHGIIQQGGRHHTPEEIMQHFGPGEGEIFARILGSDKAKAAYAASRDYMAENLGKVPLHSGVPELLGQLKSESIPISIFTGRSWNTTEMILNYHGILNDFVTIVANDHVSSPKPAPEGLILALSRMQLDPHEVLFVGDSPADLIVSHRAGAHGVAALWDLQANRSQLELHNPSHWATHPSDIWEIWKKSNHSEL